MIRLQDGRRVQWKDGERHYVGAVIVWSDTGEDVNIEEVRKAAAEFSVSVKEFTERQMTSEELVNHHINERVLARWAVDELARRDAEATERALPITEEWLKSMGATIDAEDGVIELGWLAGELVILSGGLLSWTVDCVEIGELKTRGQLLDVRNGIARS